VEVLLTDFRDHLIQMLKTPFGLSESGVTAASRIAKILSQGTPTCNRLGTINPLIDEMIFLASNTKMRDKNSSELFHSFSAISNRLQWYRRPGLHSPKFMNGHANAEIIGPMGLHVRDDIKVGVTLMRRHLTYPDHHHFPEEVYIVLSDGLWRQNQEPWWSPGTGGYVYNKPDVLHAIKSVETPLCAIWCLNLKD
jgi:hypothetical protein